MLDAVVLELVAGVEVVDDELLLPHAATAPTHSSETATANQLLNECVTKAPFPEEAPA